MKRALALFLITCMLSTGTVYAAEGPDKFTDVTESAGEYSQSEDNSDYSGAEESSGREEYSGNETEDSGTYGDSDQEDFSDYAAEGSGTYGDSGREGYSGYEAEGSGAYEESQSQAAAVSDKAGSEADAGYSEPAVNNGENSEAGNSEPAVNNGGDSEAGHSGPAVNNGGGSEAGYSEPVADGREIAEEASSSESEPGNKKANEAENAALSEVAGEKDASTTEESVRRGRTVSNSFNAVIESRNDDRYVGSGAKDEENTTRTRIAIMSDIHYVTDQLISELGRENLSNAALTEIRLMEEIDAILNAALEGASEINPDALLICGDLVSNGELLGAKALAAKLKAAREMSGFANTGFYVVNGNHDINNSYAVDFTGDKEKAAERVQPSDFKEVFSGLGYGDDDHWAGGSHSVYVPTSDDPSAVTNHGGLSYAADIADGITLIVLDTGIYRTDENGESMYNNAQQTAGYVSDDLLNWAADQAKEAKAKGNLVLAMSHHGLLPHYDVDLEDKAAFYMNSFRVPNWENVAETLADAGVSAVLTGHTHANDIATYVTKNNNVLYDVETAALCAYPCLWREFDIVTTGEGEEKSYTISIDTTYINDLSKADTSSWSFTIGGKTKTFEGDYNGNLQDYAYEKSGINEESLDDMAMYLAKNYLSDIVTSEGGFAGFLKKQLEIPEDKSLGEYMAESISNALGGFTGFSQEINNFIFKGSVTIENATAEGDVNPTFNVTADLSGITEHGKMTLDMGYLPTAADELTAKVQAKLLEGDWLTNPYASNPLLDDLKKMVQNGVIPAFSQPLKEEDPDSTAVKMFNDAWQSFSLGDEGLADDARKAKWEEERELLGGDVLAGKITQGIWNEATKMNTSEYPAISELLSQRIVPEGKAGIISMNLHPHAVLNRVLWRWYQSPSGFKPLRVF